MHYLYIAQASCNTSVLDTVCCRYIICCNTQGKIYGEASQCGYVVSTSAFRQGVPGSNPIEARKSCEVYPGLGILQPQWNPYPTLTPPSC